MIRELTISDNNDFQELGKLLNNNFANLYNLNDELKRDYSIVLGYEKEGKIVAFLHINLIQDEIDIINIVVAKEYRKQKIATKLLTYIINNYPNKKIILEVNEKNSNAYNLYLKMGFKENNRRKGYYNGDDAIIMVRI